MADGVARGSWGPLTSEAGLGASLGNSPGTWVQWCAPGGVGMGLSLV